MYKLRAELWLSMWLDLILHSWRGGVEAYYYLFLKNEFYFVKGLFVFAAPEVHFSFQRIMKIH